MWTEVLLVLNLMAIACFLITTSKRQPDQSNPVAYPVLKPRRRPSRSLPEDKKKIFVGFQSATHPLSGELMVSPLGIIQADNQEDAWRQAEMRWLEYQGIQVAPWEGVPPMVRLEAIANNWR